MRQDIKKVWLATGLAGLLAGCALLLFGTLTHLFGPPNEALQRTLEGVTEVRIKKAGMYQIGKGHPAPQTLVLTNDQAQQFAAPLQVFPSKSGARGSCCCGGSHLFMFYRDRELVANLVLKHGEKLSWQGQRWRGEMPIQASAKQFLKGFLKAHPQVNWK